MGLSYKAAWDTLDAMANLFGLPLLETLMRTSARNALRGTINAIVADTLMTEVGISVSADTTIYSLVTNESARELGLCPGREAIALIKAPFVIIASGDQPPSVSTRVIAQIKSVSLTLSR